MLRQSLWPSKVRVVHFTTHSEADYVPDKLDLSIGVAIGSSLQIALLVLPFMVLLSWFGVGRSVNPDPLTLDFDGFQVAVLFIAIIVSPESACTAARTC